MNAPIDELVTQAKTAFDDAKTPADLENAKALFLGKTGRITELMKGLSALTVDEKSFSDELIQGLKSFGEVEIEHGVATISVVGDNLRMSRGVAGRIFSALKDVNLRMISQGASEINVGFVVEEPEVVTAVNNLHREFFSGPQNKGIFEIPAGSR